MKFIKRLFRLFSIKGNKTLKKYEDNIEVYEYELQKSAESLEKLADSQSKLHSQRQVVIDKKNKAEEYLKSLDNILERAAEQEDYVLGEKTMSLIDSNNAKIQMHQVAIESYNQAIDSMETQYESLKSKLNDKKAKLDGLKAKNEFAKNMEAVNKELKAHYSEGDFNFTSFEAIEEELQGKIYFEQNRNERLTPEPTIEELVQDETRKSRFEQYVAERNAKKEPQKALDAPKVIEAVVEAEKVLESARFK